MQKYGELGKIEKFDIIALAEKIKMILNDYDTHCNAFKDGKKYVDSYRNLDYQAKETVNFIQKKLKGEKKHETSNENTAN